MSSANKSRQNLLDQIKNALESEREYIADAANQSLVELFNVHKLLRKLPKCGDGLEGNQQEYHLTTNSQKSLLRSIGSARAKAETTASTKKRSNGRWPCCSDINCVAGAVGREINRLWEIAEKLAGIVEEQ